MRIYLFLLLLLPITAMAQSKAPSFQRQFGPTWTRACAYTLETAERMPADQYGFRPVDSVFTFGEHLLHLERNLYSLCGRFIVEDRPDIPKRSAEALSKEEIIAHLKAAMQYVDATLDTISAEQLYLPAPGFWAEDRSKADIFWLMRDHMTHHRAQMIVYLRINGIAPPRFRGW